MNHVTLKTLARELRLSPGTVSKALKDSHEISIETKTKVRELAKKMHYVPNPYASSLRKRKSKTIAVVIPEVADSFFSLAINGIEAVAQEKGYHVLIYLSHESFLKEEAIVEDFKSGRVDGVLISVSRETIKSDHIFELQSTGIPVVFFDRIIEDIEAAKVTTNDFESGYNATKHLLQKGCGNIAYLSISSNLSVANKRMEGYLKALADNNSKTKKNSILFCNNETENDFNAILKLMDQRKHPDGILVSVEKLTTTVYEVCQKLKLSIPKDVKVIGFSNLGSAFLWNPSLTTVTQPAFEIGKTAASLLFKALEKRSFILKNENVIIPSALVVRNSAG
jgi:LacI family transcriptional regulator, galactose operon repressor